MLKKILVFAFFCGWGNLFAQLTVNNNTPYNSSSFLVNNILLGNGVVASNITFIGDINQIGFFNGVAANIGLDSGIVLSTGKVNDIPNGGNQPNFDYGNPGDADLLSIAQSVRPAITSSHDAASLEFDFTVVGDTVQFNFVFASDEYKTFINTNFNDVFAFFLSGPGISGSYASPAGFPNGAVNVALVPNTTTPITISTIYTDPTKTPPSMNGQYYIDNPSENTHDFNGFTTVMTIKYAVQCGGTYHFKFALADCEDGQLDTGVFLEANSLSSSGVAITATTPFPNNTIIEGCGDGKILITRSDTNFNDTIHLNISGNATLSELSPISTTQVFNAGQDSLFFNVGALIDNVQEGTDTLIIAIAGNTGCNMVTLYINDYTPMSNVMVSDSTNICTNLGETSQIWATVDGGLPPYTTNWDNSAGTGDTVIVAPPTTTYYTPTISDACGNSIIGDEIPVWVQCPIIPPNVFTPNGDGMNDYFFITNLDDYVSPSLKIYNRWGKLVFESTSYKNDWDGGKLKEGTYFYIVSPNNEKYEYDTKGKKELKYTIKGTVQLFR